MNEYVPFSFDFGNSGPKVMYQKSGRIYKFYLPSLVASGQTREQINGIIEINNSSTSIDNIVVETEFGPRMVGNLAKRAQDTPWFLTGMKRYANKEFMDSITLAALSETGLDTQTGVLVTAVPADWYGQNIYTGGKDTPLVKVIEDHFRRNFTINRVGKRTPERQINFPYTFILTETKGLLYSFVATPEGEPAFDNDTLHRQRIVVIDTGEWTTCMDQFVGLEREKPGRSLVDVSMGVIYQAVSDEVKARTGQDLETWQVRDIVGNGGYILLPHSGRGNIEKFDIMPIYEAEVSAKRQLLLAHLSNFLRNSQEVHYILLGGGGSEVLGSAITDEYRQAQILGQFATAQGLYNYGVVQCNALNR